MKSRSVSCGPSRGQAFESVPGVDFLGREDEKCVTAEHSNQALQGGGRRLRGGIRHAVSRDGSVLSGARTLDEKLPRPAPLATDEGCAAPGLWRGSRTHAQVFWRGSRTHAQVFWQVRSFGGLFLRPPWPPPLAVWRLVPVRGRELEGDPDKPRARLRRPILVSRRSRAAATACRMAMGRSCSASRSIFARE